MGEEKGQQSLRAIVKLNMIQELSTVPYISVSNNHVCTTYKFNDEFVGTSLEFWNPMNIYIKGLIDLNSIYPLLILTSN